MDVSCPRCATDYEFDDALVSERGTTVKCTNCGHQFKVRPARGGGGPERWIVRTLGGRDLVFTSLKDLQRAIAQRQVGPDDRLSRGNQPARPLGTIAELEPFFHIAPGRSPASEPAGPRTLMGVAPPANAAPPGTRTLPPPATVPTAASPEHAEAPLPRYPSAPLHPPVEDEQPTRPFHETPAPPRVAAAPADAAVATPSSAAPAAADAFAATQRGERWQEGRESFPAPERPAAPAQYPDPVAPSRAEPGTPPPLGVRSSLASIDSLDSLDSLHPRESGTPRRARSRFIVGVVVLGAAALFAGTVGRQYLARLAGPAASAPVAADPRVLPLLADARRALDDGDLEAAKEHLDKAGVLAPEDVQVLTAVARLETIRADQVWLELRAADPADKEFVLELHRNLGRRVGRAQAAVTAAAARAPIDPVVQRAQVDVARLAGDLPKARALVGPLSASAADPESAYSLAALDLAETSPGWTSIVDRLRTAAAGERGLGRARAALVYALVRAGDQAAAESELGKLEALSRPGTTLTALRAFVRRLRLDADAAPAASASAATVDLAALPVLDTRPVAAGADEDEGAGGDFRSLLTQAAAAAQRGQLDRAERLYNQVLAKQPGNTEALAGLADVARARKDPATAQKLYAKVLEENPSYLPALVAQADHKWDSGDRTGAIALYRRILDQAGPGTSYGQHAARRIAQGPGDDPGAKAPAPKPASPPGGAAPPPAGETPPEKKPAAPPPEIDTSDLPGYGK
ncbi:MAG: zinc-ribbon domain-containing protein [Polyangiaceae bacterium]|nr:zinc-ribbon domain-containing protein [Polyangiaceae bacterium]